MGLNPNVSMTFTEYGITDTGIQMNFVCYNPGPGLPTDYTVFLTDAEIAAVSNLAQFKSLVLGKLQRKFRATGIASKLDQYIGQSVVI